MDELKRISQQFKDDGFGYLQLVKDLDDYILKQEQNICYKSQKECTQNCNGICKESV
jgi:hypothetical protein